MGKLRLGASQAGAGRGRSPQRSQHCPCGRRASLQAAEGQRPPRGWSRAAQIPGCTWGRERSQRREGEGPPVRSAASGPETAGCSGSRPSAAAAAPARCPRRPLWALLTSALPQTQPDRSAQASEPTLSVPGP